MSLVMSLAPSWIERRPTSIPPIVDRDVGHFRAHLDQRDAELALFLAETGKRGGDRRGDDRLHAEVRLADHRIDVAQRRRVGGDDVDVDAEPVAWRPIGCCTPWARSIV